MVVTGIAVVVGALGFWGAYREYKSMLWDQRMFDSIRESRLAADQKARERK